METIDVEEQSILTAIFKEAFPGLSPNFVRLRGRVCDVISSHSTTHFDKNKFISANRWPNDADKAESWQNDPSFVQYLSELSSFGVEKLAQEPDRLAEERTQILEDTQTLAFHNYKTFIQTAECSREIFEDFQIIENHVEQLLTKLPEFSEQCSDVLKKAQDISSSRRMNSLTLQRHTQLLEILELPQLMDTCVRNGYYDEALELAAHVKRLEKKHATIPVVASIVSEVRVSSQLMLNQLIQQLRTNVQLPACLRVIGYLRRMDVFTEAELRIKFLQARDAWFQGILAAIPKEDAYTHINKTIEASRVNLFDIITQYRAIFSDEDPLLATSKDTSLNEAALFHGWIVQKVSQFLDTLALDLRRGMGGRLDSILGQCMYFGLSFSRVGADFRGLLTPIFQRAALDALTLALTEANKRFEENMRTYSLLSATSSMSGSHYNPTTQSGQLYPPTVLLEFPPLAEYCNDLLSALNDLRLCAPVALVTDVADCLQSSFVVANKVILAFQRAEETTFDHKERQRFRQFCGAYGSNLVPYLNRCMQALFPPAQLAQILGVMVSDVYKMGTLGQIDVEASLALVKHLIPETEVIAPTPPVTETSSTQLQEPAITPAIQISPSEAAPLPQIPEITSSSVIDTETKPAPTTEDPAETPDTVYQPDTSEAGPEADAEKLEDNAETPSENTGKPEDTGKTEEAEKSEKVEGKVQPEGIAEDIAQTLKVDSIKFSLGDTDDEVDLDKETEPVEGEGGAEEEFDIESDLSAMAADVLGTKTADEGEGSKKKAD